MPITRQPSRDVYVYVTSPHSVEVGIVMEVLSAADSISAIVSREPDASGLLPYVEDDLSLAPPQDVAERIWGLLVRDIIPFSAKVREAFLESRYGAVPYAEFQLMRVVAETCDIQDFCLSDLRRASRARWIKQIKQINAFLVSRKKSVEEYGARFQSIHKLELEEHDLARQKADLLRKSAPMSSQHNIQQRIRERTRHAIADVGRRVESLSSEVETLETEHRLLSEDVDKTRSQIADAGFDLVQIRRNMGELRPVIARGAGMLESDLAAVRQRVESVRSDLASVHSQSEAYRLAQDAMTALQDDLERLLTLKSQATTIQSQRQSLEANLAPLQRRLDQLTSKEKSIRDSHRDVRERTAQVESDLETTTQRIAELSNHLSQAAVQLDALEIRDKHVLEQLEVELSTSSQNLEEIEAIVRSRREWLEDFHVAEAASTRMEHELAMLKDWSSSQVRQ